MQFVAAGLMLGVMVIAWRTVPNLPPASRSRYGALIASLWTLWQVPGLALGRGGTGCSRQRWARSGPRLLWCWRQRRSTWAPASRAATVSPARQAPCCAAWFGRLNDRHGPLPAIRLGCALVIVAFLGMEILPSSLWSLAVGALVFDLGVMAALVSHQAIVNGWTRRPAAASTAC